MSANSPLPVAVVTGAAVGFGRALAQQFDAHGYHIVYSDIKEEVLTVNTATERHPSLRLIGDVRQQVDLEHIVEETMQVFGRIDVLINNAGVVAMTPVDMPLPDALKEFENVLAVNLRAAFILGRLVMPIMIAQGAGHIINISTDHVHTCGFPEIINHDDSSECPWVNAPRRPSGGIFMDSYDASKWALNGLTQAWSQALAKYHIRVNNVCLGATDSDMLRSFTRTVRGTEATAQEIAAWMNPLAVADIVLQLHHEGIHGRSGDNIGIWVGHRLVLPEPHPTMTRMKKK